MAGRGVVQIEPGGELAADSFRALLYLETTQGCSQYRLKFLTNDWDFWDNTLQDPDAKLKVRYGWRDESGVKWSTWKPWMVAIWEIVYDPAGVLVTLEGFDVGYSINERASQLLFKEKLVSDMVREFATKHNLPIKKIETTKGKFTVSQGLSWDAEFLKEWCLARAYNDARQDYLFYFDDGELYFAPPDLAQSPTKEFTLTTPGSSAKGRAIDRLVVRGQRGLLAPRHSLSNIVRAWDPFRKELISERIDDETVNYKTLASRKPTAPKEPARAIHVPAPFDDLNPDRTEVKLMGSAYWFSHAREYYAVPVRLNPGEPELKAGQIVRINVSTPKGQAHYTTGNYFVHAIRHKLVGGVYTTVLYLIRRTSQGGG